MNIALLTILGFLFLGIKLPKWISLRLLGFGFTLDLAFTLLLFFLFSGSTQGMIIAGIAGALISVISTFLRRLFGYIKKGRYYRGMLNLSTSKMKLKR